MKYLFIDDNADMLCSLQNAFNKYPHVVFAECHSVTDALLAVAFHQPDVVFLDHHLDEECTRDDGFEIADQLPASIKVYSTTTRTDKKEEYQRRGIECIAKTDLAKYRSLISLPKKENPVQELTAQEAKGLIERVGPRLGCDYTSRPVFPEGRKDVCAVKHTAENGRDYGYDVVYLVWKTPDGQVKHTQLKDSRSTKDYIHVKAVKVNDDGSVSVDFGSGGSYSGVPWDESMKVALQGAKPEVTRQTPASYTEAAKQTMVALVEQHRHEHPLYKQTSITESVIDEERRLAVCVLFEQIDTDRCTAEGEGYLGDQFRYSVWKMNGDSKPVQLYEDHAYIRPRSKSEMTGTRGRDCTIKDLRLEGNQVKIQHPKGEKVEEQTWEELTLTV